MADAPDCAWCAAAHSLTELFTEMGVTYYECSCCTKLTRVGDDGIPRRVEPYREPVTDVNGHVIDGP